MINFENLEIVANILQILNYYQNISQTSNDIILKELANQNEKYLKTILKEIKELNSNLKGKV